MPIDNLPCATQCGIQYTNDLPDDRDADAPLLPIDSVMYIFLASDGFIQAKIIDANYIFVHGEWRWSYSITFGNRTRHNQTASSGRIWLIHNRSEFDGFIDDLAAM